MLSTTTNTISVFGSLERALELSRNIEALDDSILLKLQEHRSLNILSSEILKKGALIEKKLMALKYSVSLSSSSLDYYEQREGRARTNLSKLLSYITKKKEELAQLEVNRHDTEEGKKKIQRKFKKVDYQTEVVREVVHEVSEKVKEAEQKLQTIIEEKEIILHTKEEGMIKLESLICEYQQYLFEYQLKGEELNILDEELQIDLRRLEELQTARSAVIKMNAAQLQFFKCLFHSIDLNMRQEEPEI